MKKVGGKQTKKIPRIDRDLQDLLNSVDDEVTQILDKALHDRTYIFLGKKQDSNLVINPLTVGVKTGNKPAKDLPPKTKIIDVYDSINVLGKLLILGFPGSGKSTTLVQLAKELIARAYSDPNHPIPVLLNLSSWIYGEKDIGDWIVDALNLKYGISKELGQKWIKERKIIPLLDGLDEVQPEKQKLCVQKINKFLNAKNWRGNIVVCSRKEEYEQIEELLKLNNSIILQPLNKQQIRDYLLETSSQSVWNNVRKDKNLLELIKLPLFLWILVMISYESISWEKWEKLATTEKRRSYLFENYIEIMFARPLYNTEKRERKKANKKQFKPSKKETLYYLSWLSARLIKENQSEFFIEKIQPYWLDCRKASCFCTLNFKLKLYLLRKLKFSLIYLQKWDACDFEKKIYIYYLILYLISGLIFGLFFWLTLTLTLQVASGIFYKPILGLIVLLTFGAIYGFIYWLISALFYNLDYKNKIRTWETINLNYKEIINQIIIGIILGFIYGVFIKNIIVALILGFIYGLIWGLIYGLPGKEIKIKRTANQGIKATIKNIFKIAVPSIIISSLILFLINQIFSQSPINLINSKELELLIVILIPVQFGLFIFLGGQPIFKHFSLRIVLWASGYAPWNYEKFLNYCNDRVLLQRVGGGYKFIHGFLQKHFAAMWNEKQTAKTNRKTRLK